MKHFLAKSHELATLGWEEGEEFEQEISKIHLSKTAEPRQERCIRRL